MNGENRHVTWRALEYLCFQMCSAMAQHSSKAPPNFTACGAPFVGGRDVTIGHLQERIEEWLPERRIPTCHRCLILWDSVVEGRNVELIMPSGDTFKLRESGA